MRTVLITARNLGLAAAVAAFATPALAQVGPQSTGVNTGSGRIGPTVSALDSNPVLQDLGLSLNIIRTNEISWEAVNTYEATGAGTVVDVEAGLNSPPQQVSRYTIGMHYYLGAIRVDYEGPNVKRIGHAARSDVNRSWDENWTGGKYSSANGGDPAFRAALIYLWPQPFARAAAYGEKGLCVDAKKCADAKTVIAKENGKDVITTTVKGIQYKATLDANNRPGTIEATIPLPGNAGPGKVVATLTNYRDGTGLGPGLERADAAGGEAAAKAVTQLQKGGSDVGIAKGEGILDKYHSGMYSPEHIVWTINGTKVLDINLTETWPNKYTVFPLPEELTARK